MLNKIQQRYWSDEIEFTKLPTILDGFWSGCLAFSFVELSVLLVQEITEEITESINGMIACYLHEHLAEAEITRGRNYSRWKIRMVLQCLCVFC